MDFADLRTLASVHALVALHRQGQLNMAQFEAACGTSRPTANDTRELLEHLGLVRVEEGRLRGMYRDKVITLTGLGARIARALDHASREMRDATQDTRHVEAALASTGALDLLRALQAAGSLPQRAAAEATRLSAFQAEDLVADLLQAGLVERLAGPEGYVLRLTAQGAAVLPKDAPAEATSPAGLGSPAASDPRPRRA